jgi:hypothetical protein
VVLKFLIYTYRQRIFTTEFTEEYNKKILRVLRVLRGKRYLGIFCAQGVVIHI